VSLEFFHWQSFRPHYGPGVDSGSNGNEYQEYFLGGKVGRCVGLTTLPPSCTDYLGSLNLLEPSGPVEASNGIALPFPLYFKVINNGRDMWQACKKWELCTEFQDTTQ
jgi:hypothetical protein